MVELPTEIWLHISHFIPGDSLRGMISVNRIFFEMAMDARYRDISFKTLNFGEIKTLLRLADPLVACRVRTLYLGLATMPMQVYSAPTGSSTVARNPYTRRVSLQRFLKDLASVFPGMCNIEEFTFTSSSRHSDLDLQAFSLVAWPILNKTLRKLTLWGTLKECGMMLVSRPSLGCLRELDLSFFGDDSFSVTDAATLLDPVAPLAARVSTQLTSLKVLLFTSADASSFFKQLCPFPSLRWLEIYVGFIHCSIGGPSSLAILLSGSASTLRHLVLRLDSPADHATSPPAGWLLRTLAGDSTISSSLQTLELSLPGAAGLEAMFICIQRCISTLMKLVVFDHSLKFEEIETIVQLFRSHGSAPLESLELNVPRLNVDLFDLLRNSLRNFSELRYLTLDVRHIMDGDLVAFKQAMKNRSFLNWKLYDITIRHKQSQLDSIMIASIAEYFPNVQQFRNEERL